MVKYIYYFLWLSLLVGCTTTINSEKSEGFGIKKSKSHLNVKTNTYSQKDHAPSGPLPSSFKNVKPQYEAFSRYGNPDSYVVDGHVYRVLRNSTGYKSRGIASWYATKFHNKRASGGDEYDMYDMTAAHKTLPIPTYIKVKNLNNSREVIVKVNDRGPFHEDRLLDLSFAAAVKLGIFPKGTAPVEIEALTPSGRKHLANYYIQAGAFNSVKLAQLLQNKLTQLTPSPVVIERYKEFYIVKVGPFTNKNMTDHLKLKLATNGVQGAFSLLQ